MLETRPIGTKKQSGFSRKAKDKDSSLIPDTSFNCFNGVNAMLRSSAGDNFEKAVGIPSMGWRGEKGNGF